MYFFPENDAETVLLIDCWESEEVFHHKSPMMEQIVKLREKYNLKMRVEQYKEISKDNQDFDMIDVKDIFKETTREDKLFDYANIRKFFKRNNKNSNEKDKNDFEISL